MCHFHVRERERESERTGNRAKKEEISVSRGVADVGNKGGKRESV